MTKPREASKPGRTATGLAVLGIVYGDLAFNVARERGGWFPVAGSLKSGCSWVFNWEWRESQC